MQVTLGVNTHIPKFLTRGYLSPAPSPLDTRKQLQSTEETSPTQAAAPAVWSQSQGSCSSSQLSRHGVVLDGCKAGESHLTLPWDPGLQFLLLLPLPFLFIFQRGNKAGWISVRSWKKLGAYCVLGSGVRAS